MLKLLKRSRLYWGSALMTLAVTAWATPARASTFDVRWLDTDDLVGLRTDTYRDGTLVQDYHYGDGTDNCEPACYYALFDDAVLATSFDVRFNIYDEDGVTLSDTWEIQGVAGQGIFFTPFYSDVEGHVLQPLPNATSIVETGDLQNVFAFAVINPNGTQSSYQLRFVSERDSAAVPEPASLLLLGSGLLGAAWRRRRSVGASRQN